ncbi:hypothetical protein RMR21_005355 [Agrobacterium sp. rho-8.1]|nr:hypothetical protein [Agrobacterium sp. rho-8.1]
MARPVSDEEISGANSGFRSRFDVWASWNLTHTASIHNQTYQDQEFLRLAWYSLKTLGGQDTLASKNLAHFLSGTGTSKNLPLNQLFQQDGGVTKEFNSRVGAQIYRAESVYKMLKRKDDISLEDFLKSNLRQYADPPQNSPVDFKKDYGPSPGPYDGHVEVKQTMFANNDWKNTTGGLSLLWIYLGSSGTGVYKQHRVSAFCLKRYKWHPQERRDTQLLHIASENAKAPSTDTFTRSAAMDASSMGARTGVVIPKNGEIKLGSETIGHWKDEGLVRQTTYNPAREYLLIFPPVERIVPVFVPTSKTIMIGG